MNILSTKAIEHIIELFMYMPEEVFKGIFLNEEVIKSSKLSKKDVADYTERLRTNIVTTLVAGLQKMKDGNDLEFEGRCIKLYNDIASRESPTDKQLKAILKANNIFTRPN